MSNAFESEIEPLVAALQPVAAALESLDIPHYVGGSVASMAHGEYRQTNDVDIVAALQAQHVQDFVANLSGAFYADENMIRDALRHNTSFNLLHLEVWFKVDIFLLKNRPYDLQAIERRQRATLGTKPPLTVWVAAPEDILIAKLEWFRLGGEVSDRQWRDILGICKIQLFDLGFDYLHRWSRELKVHDLLEKALDEAGISNTNSITGIEL